MKLRHLVLSTLLTAACSVQRTTNTSYQVTGNCSTAATPTLERVNPSAAVTNESQVAWRVRASGCASYKLSDSNPASFTSSIEYSRSYSSGSHYEDITVLGFDSAGSIQKYYALRSPSFTVADADAGDMTVDLRINGQKSLALRSGESATLSWSVTGATNCMVGTTNVTAMSNLSTGALSTPGLQSYTLSCTNPNAAAPMTNTVSVNVIGPVSVVLRANGSETPATIAYGQDSTLSWVAANATSCTLNPGNIALGTTTSRVVSPTAQTTYTISCQNQFGTATDDVTLTTRPVPTVSLLANGQTEITVPYYQTTPLSWSSRYSTGCSMSPNPWPGTTMLTTDTAVSGRHYADTTYTVTCVDAADNTARDTAKVVVNQRTQGAGSMQAALALLHFNGTNAPFSDALGLNNAVAVSGVDMPVWNVSGKRGQGIQFAGAHALTLGSRPSINGKGDFTVMFWVYTLSTGAMRLVQQYDTTNVGGSYSIWMNAGKLYYQDNETPTVKRLGFNTSTAYNDGKWHQVAFVRNANGGRIFVDGVAAGSQIFSTADVTAGKYVPANLKPQRVFIGYDGHATGSEGKAAYTGYLDELAIYNRDLSEAEISAIYNGR
ncbi:LamG domain-containing protein [bacterium]|nr:LamG domain-containing protein [bacterium]